MSPLQYYRCGRCPAHEPPCCLIRLLLCMQWLRPVLCITQHPAAPARTRPLILPHQGTLPPHLHLEHLHFISLTDEPHGSLFAYFLIFAPLVDNHVIVSHVTGITQPILTFTNHFRSFATISNHFQSFLVICDDFYLQATSRAHCNSKISTMWHCRSYTVR